jgi:hypothetical protein
MNNDNNEYNYNANDDGNDNESELTYMDSGEELDGNVLNVISNQQTKVTKHKLKKVPLKKSWVWNWFAEINLPNGKKGSECQVPITTEKTCKKRYVTDGSTGNLITHLYSKHQIVEATKESDLMVI